MRYVITALRILLWTAVIVVGLSVLALMLGLGLKIL